VSELCVLHLICGCTLRYFTYNICAVVELDKDEDWKVNFLPPFSLFFHLPYSNTEEFIATLQSSVSTEIKVSVSFSFKVIFSPSFLYFPLVCMAATAAEVV